MNGHLATALAALTVLAVGTAGLWNGTPPERVLARALAGGVFFYAVGRLLDGFVRDTIRQLVDGDKLGGKAAGPEAR